MRCYLVVAFVLTVLVGALFASESGPTETGLVEAGYELATKAASLYVEESFPGSRLGLGEPVYDILDESSVLGWYYIIGTEGLEELSFSDFIEYDKVLYSKYMEPRLTGVYSKQNYDLTKYNESISRYRAIYISNYLDFGPVLLFDSYWRTLQFLNNYLKSVGFLTFNLQILINYIP
jgi:hypothetical protein